LRRHVVDAVGAEVAELPHVRVHILDAVESVIRSTGVRQIIHLGALQVPFCKADPPRGALVNVVGTVNVFEAARRCEIPQVVYTSSIAVYGDPISLYGVYKTANEGTARAYWTDFGVASVGLRPMTVYGPGRDQGMTSSPTKAIVAAVLGYPYEITFGGSTLLQFAPDVASALLAAASSPADGPYVYNLEGIAASISEIVATLEQVVADAAGLITIKPDLLPFPDDIDTSGLQRIDPPPVTPLVEAISDSVGLFQDLHRRGALIPEEHGLTVVDGTAVDAPVVARPRANR